MSRPITEPSTQRDLARANWDTSQLYRRPDDFSGWHIALSGTPVVDPDSYNLIPFDTGIADSDGYADLTTGLVTIPPGLGGFYLCSFTADVGVVDVEEVALILIRAQVAGVGDFYAGYKFEGNLSEEMVIATAGLFDLPAGTTIDCHIQNRVAGGPSPVSNVNGGSNVFGGIDANTWFTGVRFPFSVGLA